MPIFGRQSTIHTYILHVYIFMFMYIYIYIPTYIHTYVQIHIYVRTYIYIHTYVRIYTWPWRIYTYVCIDTYIRTYLYIHTYVRTCKYIHTIQLNFIDPKLRNETVATHKRHKINNVVVTNAYTVILNTSEKLSTACQYSDLLLRPLNRFPRGKICWRGRNYFSSPPTQRGTQTRQTRCREIELNWRFSCVLMMYVSLWWQK